MNIGDKIFPAVENMLDWTAKRVVVVEDADMPDLRARIGRQHK